MNNKKVKIAVLVAGIIVVLIVLAAFIFISNSTERKTQAQLDLGNKYLNEMNYEEAKAAYEDILKIDPNNKDAVDGINKIYIDLSSEVAANEDYEGAIVVLEEGIELLNRYSADTSVLEAKVAENNEIVEQIKEQERIAEEEAKKAEEEAQKAEEEAANEDGDETADDEEADVDNKDDESKAADEKKTEDDKKKAEDETKKPEAEETAEEVADPTNAPNEVYAIEHPECKTFQGYRIVDYNYQPEFGGGSIYIKLGNSDSRTMYMQTLKAAPELFTKEEAIEYNQEMLNDYGYNAVIMFYYEGGKPHYYWWDGTGAE